MPKKLKYILAIIMLFGCVNQALAKQSLSIVVVANFISTMEPLVKEFEQRHDVEVRIIPGSTGKLYAQIMSGAPYDLFFSADIKHVSMLIEQGKAMAESRKVYAIGKLALIAPGFDAKSEGDKILVRLKHIAIANPALAPYGEAAKSVMINLNYWDELQDKLVIGESVGQTMQFIVSGAVDGGFVALSQVIAQKIPAEEAWIVPQTLYQPLIQEAVIINPKNPSSELFMRFIESKAARAIIAKNGYSNG